MANKAVFLDRDDTLIQDPGYINHPDQVHLLPGAGTALVQLRKMGYLLIVVTNQSGIARGIVTEEQLAHIHNRLNTLLADEGVTLDAIYYCPYHPDGVIGKYRMESDLRKPSPGMLLKAADEMNINLEQSWAIGDSYRDIAAGQRAGCKTILIDSASKPSVRKATDPVPDHKAVNIRSAVNIIRMFELERKPVRQPDVPVVPDVPIQPGREPKPAAEPIPEETPAMYSPAPAVPSATAAPEAPPAPEPPVRQSKPIAEPEPQGIQSREPKPERDAHESTMQEILRLLRSRNRQDLYEDFSFARTLAMLSQTVAIFFVVASVWFWLDSDRPATSAQMMVSYALFLQLITIALLLVRKDR